MSKPLTKEQFMRALPKETKNKVSDTMMDNINNLLSDPVLRENFRDNLLGYTDIMRQGNFKLPAYINAVRFVSFKLAGNTNLECYAKTFPDRYSRLIGEGASDDTVSSYATMFNKGKLVNLIYEQTLVPTHILNADVFQRAINTQAYLMSHAKSEKVQTDAANSLLNHLKRPETHKIELDIGYKEDSSIAELREATATLVRQQKEVIALKVHSVKEIAESKIIEGELVS